MNLETIVENFVNIILGIAFVLLLVIQIIRTYLIKRYFTIDFDPQSAKSHYKYWTVQLPDYVYLIDKTKERHLRMVSKILKIIFLMTLVIGVFVLVIANT